MDKARVISLVPRKASTVSPEQSKSRGGAAAAKLLRVACRKKYWAELRFQDLSPKTLWRHLESHTLSDPGTEDGWQLHGQVLPASPVPAGSTTPAWSSKCRDRTSTHCVAMPPLRVPSTKFLLRISWEFLFSKWSWVRINNWLLTETK